MRVTGVSARWLQSYVNEKYENTPQEVEVTQKKSGKLTIQLDEMWSFVGHKKNEKWIWLAIDADTREIVGAYIGERSWRSAKKLWLSIPAVYRQCAVCYTDFGEAYSEVLLSKRHQAVGKGTGNTNYVERVNNTFRQRIGRLVRKTLSFSKKLKIILALFVYTSLQCLVYRLNISLHHCREKYQIPFHYVAPRFSHP